MTFTIFDRLRAHLQKSKKQQTRQGPGFRTQPFKSCKLFPKNIIQDYIHKLAKFHEQISYNLKDTFKNIRI